jgi:hypothetical protein
MNLKKLAAIIGLGVALAAPAAVQAQETWSFEDDDIDFILDPITLEPKTSGEIAVGDVFVSVFEIPEFTIDGVPSIPEDQQLTGVAAVQLVEIIGDGGIGTIYVFQAYTGGLNTILALGTDPDASCEDCDAGEGGVIAMWLNSTTGEGGDIELELNRTLLPETNCTSLEDCINQATLGTLIQVDGIATEADTWIAVQTLEGGNDLATVLATGNETLIAACNFSLSNFFNISGTVTSPLTGSCTLTGGEGLTNGAVAHSDFDAVKTVQQVPEPGTLALLAAGLLGFGLRFRARQSKS